LVKSSRTGKKTRETKETKIIVEVNLDGKGSFEVNTNVGFLNHMLGTISKHSLIDIKVEAEGDLTHHIVEDVAITLGEAIDKALGDRTGIKRFGYALVPMDDALARVVLDIGGRPYSILRLNTDLKAIESLPVEDVEHFLRSFSHSLKINLHAEVLYGENDHHKIEAVFKGLALALYEALSIDPKKKEIPSTKGIL
jgi:imidazoleglycerol-phosphate dehydratase